MAYQQPDPFWDFIRSFDPNTNTSNNPNANSRQEDSYPPEFIRGFPFFNPSADWRPQPDPSTTNRTRRHPDAEPANHRHRGPHARRNAPPQPWANGPFAWADWAASGAEGHPLFAQQQAQQQQAQQQQAQQQAQQQQAQQQQAQRQAEQARQQAQQQAEQARLQAELVKQRLEQQRAQQEKEQQETENPGSPDTARAESDTTADPAEVTPDASEFGGDVPPAARAHCRRGGRHGQNRQAQNAEIPQFPFDLSALLSNISSHPFLQNLQEQANKASDPATGASTSPDTFTPPLDLFSTPKSYILHLPIPGALKSDIGVDWDPERQTLRVAGVIHRPGDEELQKMLVQSERKVGLFEREVTLPPKGADETEEVEIDGDNITAKMEDGVLVVTVPKKEKEWTEIKKIDIE